MIIFAVPSSFVSKSIGEGGKNVKRLSEVMKKRVKIIKAPNSIAEAEEFISSLVAPTQFKSLEVSQEDIILRGSMQSKAALIGRNRVRFKELEIIIQQFFGKNLKVV
jgi:transcription antitermination factor NusA-like protein